ncbi:hypothetical protein DMY89_22925 [Escherichia coli]|nr:hypothetical protein [Escherichia coli]
MTDFGGKTSIFSHPVYLFLREFSLQDFRGGSRFNNRDEAISVIREYIEIFYNRQRRHSRLGNISPAAFREKYHQRAA